MNSSGLVDLQVNGFAGIDFNAGASLTRAQIEIAMEALLATGVTCLLPTLITAMPNQLAERFAALDAAIADSPLASALCPGYHLEGPFLSPEPGFCGCHPPDAMAPPDYALVERLERGLSRPILLITIAAELPGAVAFIRAARAAGKLVAIGHSAADFDQVAAAAEAGASLATHLGNGLPQTLPKLANPIFAQLAEDRVAPTLIADGIHIPPHALKVLIRAAAGRAMLVTDAVSAAATAPGLYPFAGMTVQREDDASVRLPGQVGLAGSALCLDQAVRNLVRWNIASPAEALAMASVRPAEMLAPVFRSHRLSRPPGRLLWSDDLVLRSLDIGPISRRFPPSTDIEENPHAA